MSADPVRRRAVDLLVQVDAGGQLDSLLDAALAASARRGDDPRDRAFLAELVRGTLQWRIRYDHLIARYSRREAPTDPRLLAVLRLTLHQLVALDQVPPYAAVHQAGELCRAVRGPRFVGFVNGMMQAARRELRPDDGTDRGRADRRACAGPAPISRRAAPPGSRSGTAHPRWLVERWLERFGAERTAALLACNNEPVPLGLRVLEPMDPAAAIAALAEAGCPVTAGGDPRTLICSERPDRAAITELHRRFAWLLVQDPGVQQATSWLLDGIDGARRAGAGPVRRTGRQDPAPGGGLAVGPAAGGSGQPAGPGTAAACRRGGDRRAAGQPGGGRRDGAAVRRRAASAWCCWTAPAAAAACCATTRTAGCS